MSSTSDCEQCGAEGCGLRSKCFYCEKRVCRRCWRWGKCSVNVDSGHLKEKTMGKKLERSPADRRFKFRDTMKSFR